MLRKQALTRLGSIIAGGLMLCAASGAQAGLVGVTDIRITNANFPLTFASGFIQVSEVVATKTAGGADAALTSANAVGTFFSIGFGTSVLSALDGVGPLDHPSLYHSAGFSASEFLNIALAGPTELDSISIFGRNGCCTVRDLYDVVFLDTNGSVLHALNSFSANNRSHLAFATLPDTSNPGPNPVPEPATLTLFGLGLAGLGFARRRKNLAA